MDGSRFDEFARTLVSGRSRRSFLRAALGAAAGVSLTAIAGSEADASSRCRSDGNVCSKAADCCSGSCSAVGAKNRKTCGCSGGLTTCDPDGCVDLQSDPQHCGSCGEAASTDRGETCCAGVVTQLGTDANCATCGDACTGGGTCDSNGGTLSCTAICVFYYPYVTGTGTGTYTATYTATNTVTTTCSV